MAARSIVDHVESDRAMDYVHFKNQVRKSTLSDGDGFCFGTACLLECSTALNRIANEGVYYLMHFIALAALSTEVDQRVDFIGQEILHIKETKLLKQLRLRINEQSYDELQIDLQKAEEYYLP